MAGDLAAMGGEIVEDEADAAISRLVGAGAMHHMGVKQPNLACGRLHGHDPVRVNIADARLTGQGVVPVVGVEPGLHEGLPMTTREHGETTVFDGAIGDGEKHQHPARIHLDKPVILMPAIVAGAASFLDAKGRRRDQQVRANQIFNRVEKPGIANQPVDTFEQQIGLEIERPPVVRIVALEGLDPVTQIARLGRTERR